MESNYGTAIAALNDSLKNLAPIFQLMRSKTKRTLLNAIISRVLSKLHVIARNSDWFIALLALVVITLVLVFPQSFESRSIEKFANQSIGVEPRK